MSIVVFLGPTLPLAEAMATLDARYLPPAEAGAVLALASGRQRPPRAVVVIDGAFEQVPALRHKEVLYALSRGVRVFGAAGLGALRAAETHAFGTEGVGAVFEAFRDGALEDDDEVAVAHGPAGDGYRPRSDAMVNLRAGLRRARAAGAVAPATHDALVAAAKRAHYADRSWARLLRDGAALDLPRAELAGLEDLCRRARPDVMRADALRALAHVAALARAGLAPHAPAFELAETSFLRRALAGAR